jgi:tetrahydromethanopterin S-methyltransferase subunit G
VELETSKSVQKILDKMEETKKDMNKRLDESDKKIDSVVFDFLILKGVGAALGAIAGLAISTNFATFMRFFGIK